MPHQAVIRPEKETSRVRIVFDASSKGKNSKSLNDLLFSGPNIIPELLYIILKFRKYEIAFCGDIEKAFLNISIAQEDSKYLKFLWFDLKGSEDFKVMNMQRLPFGVTSSPFILTATIKNHLKKHINVNPECVNMLNSSLYVDDLFYGTDTVKNTYRITSDAVDILKHASMNLCKFNSNSQELKDLGLSNNIAVSSSLEPAKILGLNWNITDEDSIRIETSALEQCIKHIKDIKKRSVLQLVAKIYDPTGFISPFIMNFKILLQKIWVKGFDWELKMEFETLSGSTQKTIFTSFGVNVGAIFAARLYKYLSELFREVCSEIHVWSDTSIVLYWIPQLIRKINRCLACKKYSVKSADQLSGQLPRDRISESPPFTVIGVDFTGPVYVKLGNDTEKSYIALYTCAVTRAVHIELMTGLSTRKFILALRRFLSRRSNCKTIYSDNASTFKCANKKKYSISSIL
ncbi:transposable element Tcb2 transposase [Trichonephila clavata]|uniref:Transposable element Tcb2 transposase n=1 Tax=Trichonephila clavata TaxID=2740835 RepID=A0A8X6HJE7_TRICU|nr:transposable element Tcb2 transposase [Trichonephila clavata]